MTGERESVCYVIRVESNQCGTTITFVANVHGNGQNAFTKVVFTLLSRTRDWTALNQKRCTNEADQSQPLDATCLEYFLEVHVERCRRVLRGRSTMMQKY